MNLSWTVYFGDRLYDVMTDEQVAALFQAFDTVAMNLTNFTVRIGAASKG